MPPPAARRCIPLVVQSPMCEAAPLLPGHGSRSAYGCDSERHISTIWWAMAFAWTRSGPRVCAPAAPACLANRTINKRASTCSRVLALEALQRAVIQWLATLASGILKPLNNSQNGSRMISNEATGRARNCVEPPGEVSMRSNQPAMPPNNTRA